MKPEELAPHYSRFRVTERVLLTGHSHQAWPDVAFDGQREAFDDAAEFVDDKWLRASAKAELVRDGYRALLGEPRAAVALGASTHDLVLRFLSALDLKARPRLVTTDGEFHTLRRQLGRLGEAGIEVVRVHVDPVDTLAERMAHAVDEFTAAAFVSSVLFSSSRIVPGLPWLARACEHRGAELLVDVYHQLGAVPFELGGLERTWIVGGGYKYLELGEGNCFMRLPHQAEQLRPVITGWYGEFDSLAAARTPTETQYSSGGDRYAGATYDPTSHYRAAKVFAFFTEHGLTPHVLRGISLRQTTLIADRLGLTEARQHFGGFVALSTRRASELRDALRAERVHTDTRGDVLRIGPAPYVTDDQLHRALDVLTTMMR
jgi:kynureninase